MEEKCMQITINIDPEKIDYAKITDKIVERIENIPIEELLDSSGIAENVMKNLFWNDLYKTFHQYIVDDINYIDKNGDVTQKFKNEVVTFRDNFIKEAINDKVKGYVADIEDDSIKEAITKIAPNILCSIMIEYLSTGVRNSHEVMRYQAFEDAKGVIRYAFNSNGMHCNTPWDYNNLPNSDY